MRSALVILVALLLTTAGGYALCTAAGWSFDMARVIPAGLTALVATGAAFVPIMLSRGATQPTIAQAGLVGTMIHLFGCLAGATLLLLVLKQGIGTAYWVLAFYWATLAALVVQFGRAVRNAPMGPPPATSADGFTATSKQ